MVWPHHMLCQSLEWHHLGLQVEQAPIISSDPDSDMHCFLAQQPLMLRKPQQRQILDRQRPNVPGGLESFAYFAHLCH